MYDRGSHHRWRGTLVHCHRCDQEWHTGDYDALLDRATARWWCRDEPACRRRREILLMRMQAALDAAWAALDKIAGEQQ